MHLLFSKHTVHPFNASQLLSIISEQSNFIERKKRSVDELSQTATILGLYLNFKHVNQLGLDCNLSLIDSPFSEQL